MNQLACTGRNVRGNKKLRESSELQRIPSGT
jgi:hypothetical protein